MYGLPLIRDYPARSISEARYSWALLRRDQRVGALSNEDYQRHAMRVLTAIARFANEQNGRGVGDK